MLEAEMQISYASQNPARPLLCIQKKSGGAILTGHWKLVALIDNRTVLIATIKLVNEGQAGLSAPFNRFLEVGASVDINY